MLEVRVKEFHNKRGRFDDPTVAAVICGQLKEVRVNRQTMSTSDISIVSLRLGKAWLECHFLGGFAAYSPPNGIRKP